MTLFNWLIAAVSLSNGTLLFFTIQSIWIVLRRCLFLRLEEEYWFSLGFYNSKSLNCIGTLSFFYDSKRSIGEDLFFKSILLEWFLKREMKRVKKFGVILVLNKSEERSEKKVVFVHTAVFERARNWCVQKFSPSERNFFVHVRILKQFFFHFFG